MAWGVLDIMTIIWYVGWNVSQNHMPFVYDIKHEFLNAAPQMGLGTAICLSVFMFASYMTLVASGVLLYRHRKAGVVLACIQSPLRLLTIIPPSVFFLLWPLGYILSKPSAVIGFSLTLFLELVKLSSLIFWWILSNRSEQTASQISS